MLYIPTNLFKKFQELIANRCLLRFPSSRTVDLEAQISERLKIRELSSYEDYFLLLQEDVEEFHAFVDTLTTKKTYFFRLPKQFKALEKIILPQFEEQLAQKNHNLILNKKDLTFRKEPLRIWSAGCATGEEAYSIAMTVLNNLTYPRIWDIDILATDISKNAIQTANYGVYEINKLKDIPQYYQKKYLKIAANEITFTKNITEKISFRLFNLRNLNMNNNCYCNFIVPNQTSETFLLRERFDIIFCRNVMIYFDLYTQQKLVDNLFACLKPGGYLFTGDVESLHPYKHGFKTLEFEKTYFYQKPDTEDFSMEDKRK